jgi:hypothetical protein
MDSKRIESDNELKQDLIRILHLSPYASNEEILIRIGQLKEELRNSELAIIKKFISKGMITQNPATLNFEATIPSEFLALYDGIE